VQGIVDQHKYKDFKSAFQEAAQAKFGVTPTYRVMEDWGPDHNKTFKVGVFVHDKQLGVGEGSSKQRAEQSAAKNGLDNVK
jgi:ribonuclease-3